MLAHLAVSACASAFRQAVGRGERPGAELCGSQQVLLSGLRSGKLRVVNVPKFADPDECYQEIARCSLALLINLGSKSS
jgi:hypothetical protein